MGVSRTCFFDEAQTHPEVRSAVRAAIETLRNLGATVQVIDLPLVEFGQAAQWAISYSEAFAFHRRNFFGRRLDYGDRFLQKIATGGLVTAEEVVTAQQVRRRITDGFLSALEQVDAIVAPTTGFPANRVDGGYPTGDHGHLTRPVSLTGLPALSVPCGFTAQGLPVGLQIVGRAWEEERVLAIGHAYEQATDWHRRRPAFTTSDSPDAAPTAAGPSHLDAGWAMDAMRLNGLTFLEERDAAPIARTLGPIKDQLRRAQKYLPDSARPYA